MRTLIKNGTIVTSENQFKGDILIEGEKIKCVSASADAEADRVIDAEGKYVLPGGIDQHVHFSFVYKGSKVRGFETSNAAALGGTTTVIEFVNQVKDNIAVRTAADTAHGIIRPHQNTLCLAHTGINGVVVVIGTLVQGFIKHRAALPRYGRLHRLSNRCRYTYIAEYWKCLPYNCREESANALLQQE